jgi:Ras-related protein Rab-11A
MLRKSPSGPSISPKERNSEPTSTLNIVRTKSHKKHPSDQGGWMNKSLSSGLNRTKSISKSYDRSEGSLSSCDEHPKKLVVQISEATNLFDIENNHYLEISVDCLDEIQATKPQSGVILKWNKKFNFHFIAQEDIKIKFAIKTTEGEKAFCELVVNNVFVGKTEKSKRQLCSSNGASYCTLYYEISFEEESKKDKRLSQKLSNSKRDLNFSEGGSGDKSEGKGSPKKSMQRNSAGPLESPLEPRSTSVSSDRPPSTSSTSLGDMNSRQTLERQAIQNNQGQKEREALKLNPDNRTPFGEQPNIVTPISTQNNNNHLVKEEALFSARSAVTNRIADYVYKVIIVGDAGVGKSCLIKRWIFEEFQNTVSTICVETQVKSYDVKGETVSFQVWDTAGQEKFRAITNSYYRGAHGVIIVYDVTHHKSFDNVTRWLRDVESFASSETPPKVLLIANKIDAHGRAVTTQQGKALAQSQDLFFMEASALTGNHVQSAIQILLQEIHKNQEMYGKTIQSPSSGPIVSTTSKGKVILREKTNGTKEIQKDVPTNNCSCGANND